MPPQLSSPPRALCLDPPPHPPSSPSAPRTRSPAATLAARLKLPAAAPPPHPNGAAAPPAAAAARRPRVRPITTALSAWARTLDVARQKRADSTRAALREDSCWLPRWLEAALRHAVLIACAANILLFPAQLAFGGAVAREAQPRWWAAYAALDGVLWLEVATRLFVPRYNSAEAALVYNRRAVALAYATSPLDGMAADLLVRFPWDAAARADWAAAFSYGHLARVLLLRRFLVLISTRLRGGRRYFSAATRLLQLAFQLLLAIHWFACLLFLCGRLMADAGKHSWLYGVDWPSWPLWAQYFTACDRALLIIVGEGVHGNTHEEVALGFGGLLFGTTFLAYCTSTMVSLVTCIHQETEDSLLEIQRVDYYLRNTGAPLDLRRRARAYLQHVLLNKKLELHPHRLLRDLSSPMRVEAALHRCSELVMAPRFFQLLTGDEQGSLSPRFIKALVMRLQLAVFSPSDCVVEEGDPGNDVFFVASGHFEVSIRNRKISTLTAGDCFGEIAVLIPNTRRAASITALTFAEAHMLTVADFNECLADFPHLRRRFTKRAEERLKVANEKKARQSCLPLCDGFGPNGVRHEPMGDCSPIASGSEEEQDCQPRRGAVAPPASSPGPSEAAPTSSSQRQPQAAPSSQTPPCPQTHAPHSPHNVSSSDDDDGLSPLSTWYANARGRARAARYARLY
ncbi:hypothetical protein AB1Y20_009676 [Prymnesium parvum]|uniref:Cyclic nucleotide-binding domain-containing protein n=1 Tax=Prymnesium parvum TaxID=97485 RepID=A0AB34K256_PRYPA